MEHNKRSEDTSTRSSKSSKQDSLDKPESRQVRSTSPRRLIKQVALAESPPEDEPHGFYRGVHSDKKHHSGDSSINNNFFKLKVVRVYWFCCILNICYLSRIVEYR